MTRRRAARDAADDVGRSVPQAADDPLSDKSFFAAFFSKKAALVSV
jgi:hypothetical protein